MKTLHKSEEHMNYTHTTNSVYLCVCEREREREREREKCARVSPLKSPENLHLTSVLQYRFNVHMYFLMCSLMLKV